MLIRSIHSTSRFESMVSLQTLTLMAIFVEFRFDVYIGEMMVIEKHRECEIDAVDREYFLMKSLTLK